MALPAWKCQAVTPRTPITEYEKQTNASRHRQEKRGPLSHRSANRAHRARHCVRGFCEDPAWSSALFCTMNSETTPDHSSSALHYTAKKRPHKLNYQLDLDPRAPAWRTNSSRRQHWRVVIEPTQPRRRLITLNSRPSSTLRAIRSLLARSKSCPVKSPPELVTLIASVDDPAYLADKVVGHLCIQFPEPRAPSWSNG